MQTKIVQAVEAHREAILASFSDLHAIPEWGFNEFKTAAYLQQRLEKAGINIKKYTETGFTADIVGSEDGPTVGLRGDIDALPYKNEAGETYYVHACGHDSHATMVLWTTLLLKELGLVKKGTFRAIFQPAEECLTGAREMIAAGAAASLDELYGVHIRPIQEARVGQASPALWHSASTVAEVTIHGQAAHGARPHLGTNAIDGAALAILGLNSIWVNPAQQWSVKVTKIIGGGTASNIIPDQATFTLDMRAASNALMDELVRKVTAACEHGAAAVGGYAEVNIIGGVPAAEYDEEAVSYLRTAIEEIIGSKGLLPPIYTPGGEDFHQFKQADPKLKTAYMALGSDCTPGLHDPKMTFDREAILIGVKILTLAMAKRLGCQ